MGSIAISFYGSDNTLLPQILLAGTGYLSDHKSSMFEYFPSQNTQKERKKEINEKDPLSIPHLSF